MGQVGLPTPAHFDPCSVGGVWRAPYQKRAAEAKDWASAHGIQPASRDRHKLCLLLVDEDFRRFASAGMPIVRSTDPIRQWPGMAL